jgi:hypothetical protein
MADQRAGGPRGFWRNRLGKAGILPRLPGPDVAICRYDAQLRTFLGRASWFDHGGA